MAPEGSIPGPHEPTTGPYSEPDECSPHPVLMFLYDAFWYYAYICV
jgi:hypothetical protein